MIIYTDGSAHPNPGPGGFGVVVLDNNENLLYTYSKQCAGPVTNNEMELKAILYAFLNYGVNINDWNINVPIVYSDSNYCVQTFNDWMFKWTNNNWIKSDKKIPENLELIQAYYNWYQKGYRIDLRKIKGHNGYLGNELADKLATGEVKTFEEAKSYYEQYGHINGNSPEIMEFNSIMDFCYIGRHKFGYPKDIKSYQIWNFRNMNT